MHVCIIAGQDRRRRRYICLMTVLRLFQWEAYRRDLHWRFYEGKSKPVNLELQQIMVQLDYIEQTGHGVPLIVSRYGKEVFDITENFITVTIPLNKTERTESALLQNKKVLLEDSDEKIVSLMKENSSIKVNEISRQVGLGMTTITKRIRQLKEKGLIERKGSKKKGYWIVNIK